MIRDRSVCWAPICLKPTIGVDLCLEMAADPDPFDWTPEAFANILSRHCAQLDNDLAKSVNVTRSVAHRYRLD
jgi:hypothetical protein